MSFDPMQQFVLKHFNHGEHCVQSEADVPHCGDALLMYLLSELSNIEDCEDVEEAVRRLDAGINKLETLKSQFRALSAAETKALANE